MVPYNTTNCEIVYDAIGNMSAVKFNGIDFAKDVIITNVGIPVLNISNGDPHSIELTVQVASLSIVRE